MIPPPSKSVSSLAALIATLLTAHFAQAADEAPHYYLTERVSVSNGSGIFAVNPGSRVSFVSATKGGMKVMASSGVQFDVAASQVTSDPVAAAALNHQHEAAKSAMATQSPAATASAEADMAKRAESQVKLNGALERLDAEQKAAATTTASGPKLESSSALDEPAKVSAKMVPRKKEPANSHSNSKQKRR